MSASRLPNCYKQAAASKYTPRAGSIQPGEILTNIMPGSTPQPEIDNGPPTVDRRFSRKAILCFVCGILSLAFPAVVRDSESDLYFLSIPLFGSVALLLGVLSLREVAHSSGRLRGGGLAGWGIGLPLGVVLLYFLLQPFV